MVGGAVENQEDILPGKLSRPKTIHCHVRYTLPQALRFNQLWKRYKVRILLTGFPSHSSESMAAVLSRLSSFIPWPAVNVPPSAVNTPSDGCAACQFFATPSMVRSPDVRKGESGFSGSSPRKARRLLRSAKSILRSPSILRFSADHAANTIRHSLSSSPYASRRFFSR